MMTMQTQKTQRIQWVTEVQPIVSNDEKNTIPSIASSGRIVYNGRFNGEGDGKMIQSNRLEQYRSPVGETSVYKGVPMRYLETVQTLASFEGVRIRVRYRGPRAGNGGCQAHCLKVFATSFAVYLRK